MEPSGRFHEGDRIEWVGPKLGPLHEWPQPGEQGWILMLNPMDDIIAWDECGTMAWSVADDPNIVRVNERNEPDPTRRLPHDPFGPEP
jgi:hypothetical protein